MDRAKGPSDVKIAPTLSTVRRPRSAAKRGLRKAKRGAKKPRRLVLPHTQYLTPLHQTPRKTTHCVLHHGAESQRVTRFVSYNFIKNSTFGTCFALSKCLLTYVVVSFRFKGVLL